MLNLRDMTDQELKDLALEITITLESRIQSRRINAVYASILADKKAEEFGFTRHFLTCEISTNNKVKHMYSKGTRNILVVVNCDTSEIEVKEGY